MKEMTRRVLLCWGFLLLAGLLYAAQPDSLRMGYAVRGVVVDAATGRALESVHVSIPGRHQATVTNADGLFVLKSDREIREVECSFLGYRTRREQAGGGELRIALRRENLQLDAASIISGNPRTIVLAALERRWETCGKEPELLECFYRETLRKRNRYTYVAEAVARMYKGAYDGTVYRDHAALEKSRVLVSQRRTDTLSVKTQGGPVTSITFDVVRNDEILFNRDDLPLYDFEMGAPAYIGDRLQFVIHLSPGTDAPYALYHGTLYIDRELLSFTRIELSLDMSEPGKVIPMILVHKPFTLRFIPEEVSFVLNYQLDGSHTRLQYFRSTMRFACDWRKRLFKTRYTAINELVVTDVLPQAAPIPRAERFRPQDCLNDKAREFLDTDLWAGYNIIEPSESLEHAIARLRKGR